MALIPLKQQFKLLFFDKKRRIYAVLQGRYKGEWLVIAKEDKDHITFFSLPDKYIRLMPKAHFLWGLQNNVLEAVDVLPKGVYNVCLAEYKLKSTDANTTHSSNRRQQYSASDVLDSK